MDDSVRLGDPMVTCQPHASLEAGRFKIATFGPWWIELDEQDTQKLFDALARAFEGGSGATFPATNHLDGSAIPRDHLVDVETTSLSFVGGEEPAITFDARDTRKIYKLLKRNLAP